MSILRQFNWLSQARVDIPHLRSLESSIAADFDAFAGKMIGGSQPLILKGFNIAITTGTIGGAASSLQVVVANGMVIHVNASEAGSIFVVPSTRSPETLNSVSNSNVSGTFTANTTNYVGLDLVRSSDTTTTDVVQFLDANSLLETPKSVPLARTLNYKFIIATTPFSANTNICPIAKVITDANGNVTSITDARELMFRLGSGGDVPNTQYAYPWAAGRKEVTTNNSTLDMFSGGDKQIGSHADWVNAIMTRLWELGGGEYWYSATADRGVKMIRTGSAMANGDWFTWDGTNLTWQGIRLMFDNSTGYFNDVANQTTSSSGLTNLADGECLYVDLDRTTNRTGGTALVAVKAALNNLGTPTTPGSRFILAWRNGTAVFARDQAYPVGQQFTSATTSALGLVELNATSSTPATPIVATSDASGNVIGTALTRNNGSGFVAGNIGIGTGSNDNTVTIGRAGQGVTLASNPTLSATAPVIATTSTTNPLVVNTGALASGSMFDLQNNASSKFTISFAGQITNSLINKATSSSSGSFTTSSTTQTNVTNLSVTLTTVGRPVMIYLQSDGTGTVGSGNAGTIGHDTGVVSAATYTDYAQFSVFRDGTTVVGFWTVNNGVTMTSATVSSAGIHLPASMCFCIDTPTAGSHTWVFRASTTAAATGSATVTNCVLVAIEL